VCSHFQRLILDQPRLWSTIALDWPLERIIQYLNRAKLVPLRLYILGDLQNIASAPSSIMCQLQARTNHVDISTPGDAVVCFLNQCPMLVRLGVWPGLISKLSTWPAIPRLRHLRLSHLSLGRNLPLCPHVEELALEHITFDDDGSLSPWVSGMDHLGRLELSHMIMSDTLPRCSAVHVLLLEHVSFGVDETGKKKTPLGRWLSRMPSLVRLALTDVAIGSELPPCPTLQDLDLNEVSF
jgi:hypothetical protein